MGKWLFITLIIGNIYNFISRRGKTVDEKTWYIRNTIMKSTIMKMVFGFCPTHLHTHIQLHNRLPKTSRDVFILINILLGAEKQSIITRKISFKGLFTVLINS